MFALTNDVMLLRLFKFESISLYFLIVTQYSYKWK